MRKNDLRFWQQSGKTQLYRADHSEYGQLAGYVDGEVFHAHQQTGWGSFFERDVWARPCINIPLEE